MPYLGQSLTEGTRRAYTFVATSGQTTFNAVYGVGAVDVYQNGILLQPSDYNSSSGSSVVLGVGAAVNDEITIIAHNTFSVADTVSSSQGGTFAGNVSMSGTLGVTGAVTAANGLTVDDDGATPLTVDRATSFGNVVDIQKDGSTVGGISTFYGNPMFGRNSGARLAFDTNVIYSSNDAGSTADNAYALGSASSRFKDLYLSGGAYLGGTGAANKLEDYETGTYNPTINCGSGSITLNSSYDTYAYTKIGNKVTVTGLAVPSAVSSPSGTLEITLPFASANSTEFSERSNNIVGFWLNGSGVPNGSNYYNAMLFLLQNGLSYIKVYLQGYDGSYNPNPANWIGVGSDMHINFTYFAA